MEITQAHPDHIAGIAEIYAWHVEHGLATFETEPPTAEEMQLRLSNVLQSGGYWLVALEADRVLGYCYLAPYRPRYAYRFTLEDSIYLHPGAAGRGIGRALLGKALNLAEADGFRQVVAIIGNSENAASLALHRALGFQLTGVLKSVGFKHGRWLDTVMMQCTLGAGDTTLPVTSTTLSGRAGTV
ncbi:GNAT family N-acetyltransferase [Erwinia sp. MMLR14_017]|uniref:GNAT family N-acetyltransferase n=1 Tax=Erwinia sp. MMLR14_017 TaxID=3093842 RepID=UPI00298FFBC4|nr:GNAT family N-acetyltransferase [Erwinia sp. MMLR14_017]MDW8847707.1 GNAT family N-acetyltransferase [Erwinia sp. MMLR14_017]